MENVDILNNFDKKRHKLRLMAKIESWVSEYLSSVDDAQVQHIDDALLERHILERLAAKKTSEKEAHMLMAPVYWRDKYFFKTCPMPEGNLTDTQLDAVNEYWAPYTFAYKNNPDIQRYFTLMSGKFDPSYISFGLHYFYLKKFWNTFGTPFISDKNDYDVLFHDVKMPETVFHRINGKYYDGARRFMTDKESFEQCKKYLCDKGKDLILKPARDGEGRGIVFMRSKDTWQDNLSVLNTFPQNVDCICQVVIENHSTWKYSECSGLNVARVNTMNITGEPEIVSAYLKTAVKDSGVVNMASGAWGILIHDDGSLGERAVQPHESKWHYEFPNGEKFAGRKLLNYHKVKEAVIMMACRVPTLKSIAWDITVDSEGEVVLIELNPSGGTEEVQPHGVHPYGSGERLKEILNEYLINRFYYPRADWEWDYWEFKNTVSIHRYDGLKSAVTVPDRLHGKKVTAIHDNAFTGKNLKKIVVPDSVTLLRENAFVGCGEECEIILPAHLSYTRK